MALAEAEFGVTEMAMSERGGRRNGDERLLVKFYDHPRRDPKESIAAGRDIYKTVPWIKILVPGSREDVTRPATQMDIDRFPEHFRRYQARMSETESVEGTPLELWPGVSAAQVEELRFMNVRTVEQLAELSDSKAQGMMGINLLKEKAGKFLEAAETNVAAEKLRHMEEQIAEQNEVMAKMSARLEAYESDSPPKRRGRPPKKPVEDAEA